MDQEGNFYVAEVDNGGARSSARAAGAREDFMVGEPIRVAWK